MSAKNYLDGTIPMEGVGSTVKPITLLYRSLLHADYPSIYIRIGNMITLYLPMVNELPTATYIAPIQITVPVEIAPKYPQIIHGFSVSDADGPQMSCLELGTGANIMMLGKEPASGYSPVGFNYTTMVSTTACRFITYEAYE